MHNAQYVQQVEDYALCIRDFHPASRRYTIVPLVCAENAPSTLISVPTIIEGVASAILASRLSLSDALKIAVSVAGKNLPRIRWQEFDLATYNPTPNIVDAARAVYSRHSVQEIGRSDADGMLLQRTSERLRYWVVEARKRQEHTVCLVTGTPGAGKSLLGLNLVLADGAGRIAGEPAVMLTGNRPLVQVLRRALIADASQGEHRVNARRAIESALQTLLGYLREHALGSGIPPEHVVVFDEAQRAWDAETGQKLLQRHRSEPELFLEILYRLPWACLVCLVGEGQEINRGEGGMALWSEALALEASANRQWHVIAPPDAALVGAESDLALRLSGAIRAYRNLQFTAWVDRLLAADVENALRLSREMRNPPASMTRDLRTLKEWLRARRRGGRRCGLLASSGAARLVAEGIPAPPMSNDLKIIENWFLRSWPDFRGSDSLEVPLNEFGCQGLELDYVGLCWGADLTWSPALRHWVPRQMRAPAWQTIRRPQAQTYRLNSYRVLFTRAREGICIYVPRGSSGDSTQSPAEFDATANVLLTAGCVDLDL
jgi:hypothetical protein